MPTLEEKPSIGFFQEQSKLKNYSEMNTEDNLAESDTESFNSFEAEKNSFEEEISYEEEQTPTLHDYARIIHEMFNIYLDNEEKNDEWQEYPKEWSENDKKNREWFDEGMTILRGLFEDYINAEDVDINDEFSAQAFYLLAACSLMLSSKTPDATFQHCQNAIDSLQKAINLGWQNDIKTLERLNTHKKMLDRWAEPKLAHKYKPDTGLRDRSFLVDHLETVFSKSLDNYSKQLFAAMNMQARYMIKLSMDLTSPLTSENEHASYNRLS